MQDPDRLISAQAGAENQAETGFASIFGRSRLCPGHVFLYNGSGGVNIFNVLHRGAP